MPPFRSGLPMQAGCASIRSPVGTFCERSLDRFQQPLTGGTLRGLRGDKDPRSELRSSPVHDPRPSGVTGFLSGPFHRGDPTLKVGLSAVKGGGCHLHLSVTIHPKGEDRVGLWVPMSNALHDPGYDPDDEQASQESPHRGGTIGANNGNGALPTSPLADSHEEPSAPAWSVRGDAPGLRGCWAVNRQGEPCGAPRRNDSDYCAAHSGFGVAEDPARWSEIGRVASAESRRRRADLRLAIGVPRLNTPRGVLAAATFVEAERVARRVVGAVLDPAVPPAQAARLGLDLVNAVDPQVTATLTTSVPTDPEGVSKLSLSQLLTLGEQMGIPLPSPPSINGSVEPLSDEMGDGGQEP